MTRSKVACALGLGLLSLTYANYAEGAQTNLIIKFSDFRYNPVRFDELKAFSLGLCQLGLVIIIRINLASKKNNMYIKFVPFKAGNIIKHKFAVGESQSS